MPYCIIRQRYPTNELIALHPIRHLHRHKRLILDLACPPDRPAQGVMEFSRWAAEPLPMLMGGRSELRSVWGTSDYPGQTGLWHVNFSDPHLFVAWQSELMAQDEHQVAEHPALGFLLEGLHAEQQSTLTCTDEGPTPVLVSGVERRCAVHLEPDLERGRPFGLYGWRFAQARPDQVRLAVEPLIPPTISHLICMASLPGGSGPYSIEELRFLLQTAYTAFLAAREETNRLWPGQLMEVRSGFWGCGAFGGNRLITVMVQTMAARLAGVDRLCLHSLEYMGLDQIQEAHKMLEGLLVRAGGQPSVEELLRQIVALGLEWGESDGN
jgi:Poly (ADP-ribose) glycohydrolase (PARG)